MYFILFLPVGLNFSEEKIEPHAGPRSTQLA